MANETTLTKPTRNEQITHTAKILGRIALALKENSPITPDERTYYEKKKARCVTTLLSLGLTPEEAFEQAELDEGFDDWHLEFLQNHAQQEQKIAPQTAPDASPFDQFRQTALPKLPEE